MPGLTPTGFQLKTLAEIQAEIEAEQLATIDPELDTSADTAIGQLNGIFAKHVAEAWELLDSAYGQFDENKAEDSLLDSLSAITGTYREGETYGTVTISCNLTIGTPLTTAHIVGKAGDDTNRWHVKDPFTAPSTGVHAVVFQATRPGPIEALAGTLTVIKTPLAGWASATNPADAEPGRLAEEDPDLRIRRRDELRAQGDCTLPAIRADLLLVDGVESVTMFENTGPTTDARGLPPHSFEAVIWDGVAPAAANADVWASIYSNKPGGIKSHGATATTIIDEDGNAVDIAFTRATQVLITVVVQVAIRAAEYPLDGDAQIKQAIVDGWLALRQVGRDVYRVGDVMRSIVAAGIDGVLDVNTCTLATPSLPAASANVAIGVREIATFSTGSITVTTVEASV